VGRHGRLDKIQDTFGPAGQLPTNLTDEFYLGHSYFVWRARPADKNHKAGPVPGAGPVLADRDASLLGVRHAAARSNRPDARRKKLRPQGDLSLWAGGGWARGAVGVGDGRRDGRGDISSARGEGEHFSSQRGSAESGANWGRLILLSALRAQGALGRLRRRCHALSIRRVVAVQQITNRGMNFERRMSTMRCAQKFTGHAAAPCARRVYRTNLVPERAARL